MSGASASIRGKSRRRGFLPQSVPEIALGYWWEAAMATGLGTAQFKVPEGNGHSSFDLVQATVASQPTALVENGGVQFRMRNSVNANPSFIATSGTVQAGWTGATYIAGWFRLPDAGGVITSSNDFFFNHFLTTGNQRRIGFSALNNANNALDRVAGGASVDGTTSGTTTLWDTPFDVAAAWCWCELIIDPLLVLGGSVNADKIKLFVGLALQTQTQAPSLDYTALFDATAPIQVASRAAGLANVDTTDWAAVYYGQGIPTLQHRVKLANRCNPTGVPLAA